MNLLVGTNIQPTQTPVYDTNDFFNGWKKSTSFLTSTNFATPEDILELNSKIEDLETNISNIQPTVINNHYTNQDTLTDLQSQITLIKNDFTEFMKSSNAIQNSIASQVTELQNTEPTTIVNNITREITKIDEEKLKAIQDDLQQQTNMVSQNIAKTSTNQSNIDNNTSNITANSTYIQQLKEQNSQLNSNISNITTQVTNITKSFENKITEQNDIIKNLQNNISNLQHNNTAVYYSHSTPAFYEDYSLTKKPEPKYLCSIM